MLCRRVWRVRRGLRVTCGVTPITLPPPKFEVVSFVPFESSGELTHGRIALRHKEFERVVC